MEGGSKFKKNGLAKLKKQTKKQSVSQNGCYIDCDLARTNDIGIDEVKRLNSFEQYSDEQAIQLIGALKEYTAIVFCLGARLKRD